MSLGIAGGYGFGAWIGFALTSPPIPVSTLWPPNAILLAGLLLTRPRWWPLILAAVLPVHFAAQLHTGVPLGMAAGWYVSNSLEAVIGASIVYRLFGDSNWLSSARGVAGFTLAAFIAVFVSSFVDVGFVQANHWGSATYWDTWRARFFSDMLSMLTVVPSIVGAAAALRSPPSQSSWARYAEIAVVGVALIGVSYVVFAARTAGPGSESALLYVPLPLLLWIAVRFGPGAVSASVLAVVLLSTWAAVHGRGPFVSTVPEENAFSIQVLFIILSMTLLKLSAFVRERNVAETTARSAGEALRVSRERYRLATAAARVGVWDWNLETDQIFVDEQLKAMLGYEGAAIGDVVDNWFHHMPPDDAVRVMEQVRACVAGEIPSFGISHRMLHKDGEVRWFAARGTIVRVDGAPTRLVGTETDITVQTRARHELEENRRQLAHLSRVAMLGELSGAIAHELSQPLSAIGLNVTTATRYLARRPPEIEGLKQIIAEIHQDNERAGAVIGHIRSLLKKEGLRCTAVDLNDVVEAVLVLIHAELVQRRVSVERKLALSPATVLADRVQIQQLVMNLVLNACDAMRSAPPRDRRVIVGTRPADDGAVLWVSDAGPGIPAPEMARIFEPFVTSKSDGLGLGLAICRTIVSTHGGRIWAANNAERGATFTVMLPTVDRQPDDDVTSETRGVAVAAIAVGRPV